MFPNIEIQEEIVMFFKQEFFYGLALVVSCISKTAVWMSGLMCLPLNEIIFKWGWNFFSDKSCIYIRSIMHSNMCKHCDCAAIYYLICNYKFSFPENSTRFPGNAFCIWKSRFHLHGYIPSQILICVRNKFCQTRISFLWDGGFVLKFRAYMSWLCVLYMRGTVASVFLLWNSQRGCTRLLWKEIQIS